MDKLEVQWRSVRAKNPTLIPKLAKLALRLKGSGIERWSMDALFHVLRFSTAIETGDHNLKMNNNYTALAARDLMKEYPELDGFFQLRERKPRGNFGQIS